MNLRKIAESEFFLLNIEPIIKPRRLSLSKLEEYAFAINYVDQILIFDIRGVANC